MGIIAMFKDTYSLIRTIIAGDDRFEPISDKNNIEFSYNELKDITNK